MLSATGAQSYIWNPVITPNSYFVPASTTTYSVTGTDANSCSSTATLTISVSCVGIADAPGSPSLCRVYPNPSEGLFTIALDGITDFEVSVFNSIGQEMDVPVIYNAGQAELDMSQAPKGIYFLEVMASGFYVNQKLLLSNTH
jgi:hypothetical protein